MARGAIKPSSNGGSINEQRRFGGEHGENLLADITRKLEIARATERRPGDKALVSSNQFSERALGTLLTPALEKRGIALHGYVAMHSP